MKSSNPRIERIFDEELIKFLIICDLLTSVLKQNRKKFSKQMNEWIEIPYNISYFVFLRLRDWLEIKADILTLKLYHDLMWNNNFGLYNSLILCSH